MHIDSLKAIIGAYFVVTGLVMVLFQKSVSAFYEDWFGTISKSLPLMPRGRMVTFCVVLFGALSIIGGSLVFLLALSN